MTDLQKLVDKWITCSNSGTTEESDAGWAMADALREIIAAWGSIGNAGLTDARIDEVYLANKDGWRGFARAIEAEATAPLAAEIVELRARVAELEAELARQYKQAPKIHAAGKGIGRVEALEEAARVCDELLLGQGAAQVIRALIDKEPT